MPEGIFYTKLTPQSTREIIKAHIVEGRVLEEHTFYDNVLRTHVPKMEDITFFKEQLRIALRNCGVIAYDDIRAYIAKSGYMAAAKALLEMDGSGVIEIRHPRTRRRGLPDRRQVGGGTPRPKRRKIYRLQRGRRRPRGLHGPQHP